MIAISEVGMVTSVGRDAHTTLTSVVCGISRPRELSYFHVVDPELQEPQGVVGHPVEALTEGFHLYGAWLRLGCKALQDLIDRAGPTLARGTEAWRNAALIVVTPDIRTDRFMSDGDESTDALREPFLHRIAAWLGVPQTTAHVHAIAIGRTGVFAALETARALLEGAQAERVVVLAMDSLLDTMTLEWLAAQERLKGPSAPVGLAPGEAGVALLLERRGAPGLGVAIRAVAAEPTPLDAEPTSAVRGTRLAAVLSRLRVSSDRTGAQSVLFSDQNGEQWRAEEWAFCGLKLTPDWPPAADVVLPALSVGDTGAASNALACALSALALRHRGFAARESLVIGTSIDGRAGAALFTSAD